MTVNISMNENQPKHLRLKIIISFLVLMMMGMAIPLDSHASGACKELPAAEDFACNTEVTFFVCSLVAKTAILNGSYDELTQCIDKHKNTVEGVYKSSKSKLADNSQATEAMKDLYSYWLSSMDLLVPSMDERKFQYESKIQDREAGIKDRANRLKIEGL